MKWTDDGFKRIVDAAKRGRETQRKKFLEKYNNDPVYCLYCNEILPYAKRKNKFCNHTCAGFYNNKNNKHIIKEKFCLNCGFAITGKGKKFCSTKCDNEYTFKQREDVFNKRGILSIRTIKKILKRKHGHKCQTCKNDSWNNKPIPLEIEHKDGNSDNNMPENLELICPNCHAQTDTYKSKNKGKGRYYRRIRYSEGKSY